jgi:ribonucleoside-diphosphate reductase alpha chain
MLTNLREAGAPIKQDREPVLGRHPGDEAAGGQLLLRQPARRASGRRRGLSERPPPRHPAFLDTKRENADEKIRIKTLSLGVVIPDITFELAKKNEDMYLFSPYDVEGLRRAVLRDLGDREVSRDGRRRRIRKKKINAREFFQTIAEIQFESGYPYIMFEDTVNRANPIAGRITMSNLCSEILQVNEASTYNEDLSYDQIGQGHLLQPRLAEHRQGHGRRRLRRTVEVRSAR